MNRRKKIRRTGEPAAGCKEGKETEREEIVSPPWRMVLGYPENLKSILIFYKYFVNLCPGSAFFRRVSGNAAMVKPCSDPRRGLPNGFGGGGSSSGGAPVKKRAAGRSRRPRKIDKSGYDGI